MRMSHEIARFLLALSAGLLLLSAGVEDLRTREIANRKSALLLLLAPAWWWANGAAPWPDAAIQLAVGAGVFALFLLAFQLGMMGGGDVKLIGALAFWLPPAPLLAMLTMMALAGGAVTLAMLAARGLRRLSVAGGAGDTAPIEVPYGVAIAIAGMISLSEPILNQFG
jgi:prepilin peptidase CpaA